MRLGSLQATLRQVSGTKYRRPDTGRAYFKVCTLLLALACASLPTWSCAAPLAGTAALLGPRSVAINGIEVHPLIETKLLPSGQEGLPVWFLPQLGLQTRNNPDDLWLAYGERSLRFVAGHWSGGAWLQGRHLSAPERYGPAGSMHVGLDILHALGVPLSGQAQHLNVTVRQVARPLPATPHVPTALSKPVPKTTAPKSDPSQATAPANQPSTTQAGQVRTFGVVPFGGTVISSPVSSIPVSSKPTANIPASTIHTPISAPVSSTSTSNPSTVNPSTVNPSTLTTVSPDVPLIGPRILSIRSSSSTQRSVALQRVVVDLTGPVTYSAAGPLTYFLLGASAQATTQTLDSGDTITLSAGSNAGRPGTLLRLQSRSALSVQRVQTLQNPTRLVIDTAAQVGDAPPPINLEALPVGVNMQQLGALTLLTFDPQRFKPRVVAAPIGSALSVAELVRRVGGVAGVNGGYFDPPSSLSVDFVGVRGQMLSSSLEKRATVGFDAQGKVQFGYPRPRYFVRLPQSSQTLMVNAITPRPAAGQLSAFVGDGRTAAGGSGLVTLLLTPQGEERYQVQRAVTGNVVVPAGTLSLSFDARRFGTLPTGAGASLNITLDYQLKSWDGVQEGLAAGPLLVAGGRVVTDPVREAFNIYTGIWRPTRQVGFALYQGRPTIAFMDFGTPESFASALQKAGVSDAMRLDSGSSATVYVTGGYLGTGGYLNTVWSRPVPNALVLVPR